MNFWILNLNEFCGIHSSRFIGEPTAPAAALSIKTFCTFSVEKYKKRCRLTRATYGKHKDTSVPPSADVFCPIHRDFFVLLLWSDYISMVGHSVSSTFQSSEESIYLGFEKSLCSMRAMKLSSKSNIFLACQILY